MESNPQNQGPQTLLVAVNARYSHTNLAVRYLKNALEGAGIPAEFVEYTINQPVGEILADLCRSGARRFLFSCYIWNREYVCRLGEQLRLIDPDYVLLVGGPEVSFDPEEQLTALPWADGILAGEGEVLVPQVLAAQWRPQGVFQGTGYVDLDTLPFPYEPLDQLPHRVLYYESSRGCPFGCAYCLSSADRVVRTRSLDLVFQDLQRFLDARVMQVKFVDRTFNLDGDRALAIWEYLAAHDNGVTGFQMELGGDLTRPEAVELLRRARPGLFQLEIGVQSTCPAALEAACRSTDLDRLFANVRAVGEGGNVHQHLDLIAGLPGEGFCRFGQSFDQVVALRPQQLQLELRRLGVVALQAELTKAMYLARKKIGRHRDHSQPSQGHDGNNLIVVSRVDRQFLAAKGADPGNGRQIAAGLLDSRNLGMAGQPQAGLGADRHPRAAGNRVEDHREGGGIGHGGKMRNQSLLGRLVVVGRHMEESVRPQAGRQLGPGHRVGGVVAARPGNDRDPVVYLLYHKGDHLGVFLFGEG